MPINKDVTHNNGRYKSFKSFGENKPETKPLKFPKIIFMVYRKIKNITL
jgi:hypothetical protein